MWSFGPNTSEQGERGSVQRFLPTHKKNKTTGKTHSAAQLEQEGLF